MKVAIINGKICTPHNLLKNSCILIHGNSIAYVGETPKELKNYEIIDANGKYVLPGLIDLQVNGGGGIMYIDATTEEDIEKISKAHLSVGTTGILPTTITASPEIIKRSLELIAKCKRSNSITGAQILGIHMEGPFLNPSKRGGHTKDFLSLPNIKLVEQFIEWASGEIKILSLSPELSGAIDLIDYLKSRDILISLAHSDANFETVKTASDAGLNMATHVYNAMDQLGSREPCTVGAVLALDKISTGIICDMKHVHPASVKIAIKSKGLDNIFIVTDAVSPIGTNLDKVTLYGFELEVRDGACYTKDGILAGSATSMLEAIKNLVEIVGLSLSDALQLATINPAKRIGLQNKKGSLEVGKDADIVICDDNFSVTRVLIHGKTEYEN